MVTSAFIAILVYVVGGIVYQRAVMHQRGWRQLPNYALWAGIAGFVSDMFVILFSSCMRVIPFRRNKDRGLQVNGNGYGRPEDGYRSNGVEDENRIIDDLDENWRD
jgi:cation-dependent mannose-6-phosphate receptor